MVMHNNHRIIREVPQGFVIFYVVALSRKIYSARPCFKLKYLLFFSPENTICAFCSLNYGNSTQYGIHVH